ncbi:DUF4176 domain-containing protein [Streptococcus suis]|uniref:DUF4176 domain-containing protein n=1 Tax=Streptococcus suis TaxID=1307 RepID=UPI000417640D|nr:DUF4176 domain-containing protein [Streptococcus suis]MBL6503066.1 DUF4176 domain-containing protein [Streptococcus suis]MBM0241719.1 DUF4176 domain-containing protein [Streptococcus suis]MBM7137030.1 DUF4176 domain-containing protein [Streptococcus suis]MBM7203783.1 DUF4176 domain-containing protein [Streptococcus suis]MBM7282906.1 DUF4176 domain-containing protein [Streptococcus suis]
MIKLLPLGSIVRLAEGDAKLMIISRYPLYKNQGELGYFEYSACLYPTGQNQEESYFFNHEDISEVIFEGFSDEAEEAAQEIFEEKISSVTIPRFKVEDTLK